MSSTDNMVFWIFFSIVVLSMAMSPIGFVLCVKETNNGIIKTILVLCAMLCSSMLFASPHSTCLACELHTSSALKPPIGKACKTVSGNNAKSAGSLMVTSSGMAVPAALAGAAGLGFGAGMYGLGKAIESKMTNKDRKEFNRIVPARAVHEGSAKSYNNYAGKRENKMKRDPQRGFKTNKNSLN